MRVLLKKMSLLLLTCTVIICSVCTESLAGENFSVLKDETGEYVKGITTELVGVYSEASTNSMCIDIVQANEYLRILGEKGRFYKVRAKSQDGYVLSECVLLDSNADKYVKESGNFALQLLVLKDSVVSGSGNTGVIGSVSAGDVLTVIEKYWNVYKVQWNTSDYAYVPADVVTEYYDIKYHEFSDISFNDLNSKSQELQSIIEGYNDLLEQRLQNSSDGAYSVLENTSELRKNIVSYALKFVGNPYVWGGTSLTEGADCSGFCKSVLAAFGISVSRCSYTQCFDGREVALADVQPGDLVFYKHGLFVGHVAMYAGDGKVVQARGKNYGICVTDMYYAQPYCARNVID